MRRLVLILTPSALFFLLLLPTFFYWDFKNDCNLVIWPGLEMSSGVIKRALDVLKKETPKDYKNLCTHVDHIGTHYACGGFDGGCFYPDAPREIHVKTADADLAWTAAVLVHEVCHAMQFKEGRKLDEDECYRKDDRIIKKITAFEMEDVEK